MTVTSKSFLALSCVGFIATAPAYAAEPADAGAAQQASKARESDATLGEEVIVTGERQRTVESPKATQPLLDTPQTVTVISDQVLRKQNLLTLRDALSIIPGITFGAGEGGGGYGDSINLRGYSASNDLTVDGVRDTAQYSRTDPFNLQQIEVYNGANSVFNGSGSVGGTINLVTKTPRPDDLTIVQGGIGTDHYYRGAVDTNHRVNDLIAVRLNAMIHRNDYPGRDVERFKRWGVAPAVTLGVGGPTSLTFAYVHQRDDNTPIYGVPFFRGSVNDGPLPEVSRSDYFGYRNLDFQKSRLDRATVTFAHEISPALSVRNLTRWQQVKQDTITSAPQGTFCLTGTGRQPVGATPTATVGLACPAGLLPGQYLPSGPRGLTRDTENQLLYNQTDLRLTHGERGGVRNILNVGVQFLTEDYALAQGSVLRTPAGVAVSPSVIGLANPDTVYTGPNTKFVTSRTRGTSDNVAVYAFDTLELGLVELNAGVRWEKVDGDFRNVPLLVPPPGTAALTTAQAATQSYSDRLYSYRFGAVVKPTAATSLYASYGNSKTPPSGTVRLGCGLVAAPGAADPCAAAPETARNYEIGAKADVAGGKLQLTAAVFRNARSNFRVPSNDPALPAALQVLDGRSRVDGIALGATGTPVAGLTLFANYTYLDGKVLQSVSDFCRSNPGTACGNYAALPDAQAGQRLLQTPKHSGSAFASYRFPFGLEVGYGLTYQGRFALNNRVGATAATTNLTQYQSDDYVVQRALLSYTVREGLTAQLNVQNLFNEKYYTNIRNNINATTGAVTGGWAMPGEGRSAVLSLFYSF